MNVFPQAPKPARFTRVRTSSSPIPQPLAKDSEAFLDYRCVTVRTASSRLRAGLCFTRLEYVEVDLTMNDHDPNNPDSRYVVATAPGKPN